MNMSASFVEVLPKIVGEKTLEKITRKIKAWKINSQFPMYIALGLSLFQSVLSYAGFEYKAFKVDHSWGVQANHVELDALSHEFTMPAPKPGGTLVEVLNHGGGTMTMEISPFAQELVNQAKNFKKPIVEIGPAFGVATIPLLEASTVPVIATDISAENLFVLKNRTPEEYRDRLYLNTGRFPEWVDFDSESISAILICRVFHFLKGEVIDEGLEKAHRWLEEGGLLVVTTASPFQSTVLPFMSEYLNNKRQHVRWPGHDKTYGLRSQMPNIDPFLHVIEIGTLSKAMEEAGFEIVRTEYLDQGEIMPTLKLDGREATAIIARKGKTYR